MVLKNSFNYINEFFFYIIRSVRKLYLKSSFYNKKISKINNKSLEYKPSLSILSCLIKYDKKRKNIEDFHLNSIWEKDNLKESDYKKLHNFFWLFTIDLKSSKSITQSIIKNWIYKNENYNNKNWEIDILSKRVISWISNSKLTYEDGDANYKYQFISIIQKQINHLIYEINRSDHVDDKMIGCTAIILSGLCFKDEKYIAYGLNLLKEIKKYSFNNENFPKSRSLRQLIFYLKYFVLIRELLKESQNSIPEYINEIIFYLGKGYNLLWQNTKLSLLFNGNHNADYSDFDKYLQFHGYKFKSETNEIGGYAILKNKNVSIAMDIGSNPDKEFSNNYQSGALSFELSCAKEKVICNSGYFQNYKHRLNNISRSTATHSTLILDNTSITKFKKEINGCSKIQKNFKILNKKIINEKNVLGLTASHDGYQKRYGTIHERKIEFYPNDNKLIGFDKLIKKKNFKSTNFEIRFHLLPKSKVTKTQDGNVILIELENSGWKFSANNNLIDVESGLYFGNKNSFVENQNIFISGTTQKEDQVISWIIEKI